MTPGFPVQPLAGPLAVRTLDLVKSYDGVTALDHVALTVPEGAVYVLVGPNGAGKSTLIRTLLNLARPDAGVAQVFGLDARTHGPAVRARVGYVPERVDWGYGWMRVGELLAYHAAYFRAWDAAYAAELVRMFDLRVDRRVDSLSKGQSRRMHMVMALAHRPPLLLLDEPTDGLDPVMLHEALGILARHLADSPTAALISTHRVHEVARLTDHVGFLLNGKLALQVSREVLHAKLRRYRAEVPERWTGAPDLQRPVVQKGNLGRELRWVIWGDERDVVDQLTAIGASVREVAPLPLDEAIVTLLNGMTPR